MLITKVCYNFRLCFAAGRDEHVPKFLSFIQVERLTPMPSILFTVRIRKEIITIRYQQDIVLLEIQNTFKEHPAFLRKTFFCKNKTHNAIENMSH